MNVNLKMFCFVFLLLYATQVKHQKLFESHSTGDIPESNSGQFPVHSVGRHE